MSPSRNPAIVSFLALAAALIPFAESSRAEDRDRPPNVVFILTDNHGAWTMGCYGNPDIKTPNVDRMAKEGILFSQAFSNNPVCSPTRATFLTGLMPSQHGVHNFLGGGRLQTGPEARNTLADFTSLPEVLRARGYACGLVGKWHLGNNMEPNEGLDDYWITMPHGGTQTFHGAQVIHEGKVYKEPAYLTDFWTEHALKFIDQQKDGEKPFFLYLAYNGPYGLSGYQLESSGNRHAEYYADKDMPSFPRGAIHPWQYNNREYFANPVSIRRYGEELSAVDDGVGAVLDRLKQHGLDENTLVIFAADQGWAGGQHGLWGMGDHTRPVNAREYSMQIPLVFRHPAGIPGGRKSDALVSNYDFMPSVLSYLGMAADMPESPRSPGRDFAPILRGEEIADWDDTVFYEYESLRCIRTADWKYVERFGDEYDELYNLAEDPGERSNLIDNPDHAAKLDELRQQLDRFFAENATPKYDLWNGGESQPRLLVWGEEAEARAEARAASGMMATAIDPSFDPPPMTLPDGYVAEVAAAPPLVEHPIMAAFDDTGRLFVSENAGLNLKKEELEVQRPNSIRMLEDLNGDGLFDKSTVFADGLTFPQGALWLYGSLYVMSPPSLWRFEDTDGDGVADMREELVTGFDYTGNAADVHGPFLHPNGRLYWCHGRKGHEAIDSNGNLVSTGKGARIWSCTPSGTDLQAHAGGGMDNPVEIDFTDTGDIIGDVNLFYGRPRGDVLVHWLHGGAYPRYDQETVVAEFKRTGPLLTDIHNFGHVAVSGMLLKKNREWYPLAGAATGEAEGQEAPLHLYTTFFNNQKVVRTPLVTDGSTFRALTSETVLEIDNPDVHITDVVEAANGDLLVLDTGGWFRIGCPTSQVAKPDIPGAIYRIRPVGRVDKKADPHGNSIAWDEQSHEALAHLLEDPRFAVRERAIRKLAEHGEASLPALKELLETGGETGRIHAIWALTRMKFLEARELVQYRLLPFEASDRVRQAAAHSAGITQDAGAVDSLAKIVNTPSDSPALIRKSATALGQIGRPKGIEPLISLLGTQIDRPTEHAAIYALIEINHYAPVTAKLGSGDADLDRRLLWALDQMDSSELDALTLLRYLESPDIDLREAAAEIALRHSEWDAALANRFSSWLEESTLTDIQEEVVLKIAPKFIETPPMQALAGALLNSERASDVELALRAIAASDAATSDPSWEAPLKAALDNGDETRLKLALDAVAKLSSDAFDDALRAIGSDPSRGVLIRVKALGAVADRNAVLEAASFDLLKGLMTPETTPLQRLEAAQMLSEAKLNATQLRELAGLVENAGPMELPLLLNAFQRTKDEETGRLLAANLPKSKGIGNISASDLNRLMNRFPPEIYETIKPTIDAASARAEQQAARLAEIEPDLGNGDPERGREAFLAGKGACITCHQVGDAGRFLGPDLTTIGRIRTERDLLEAILYPSESIARDFESYTVTLSDGATHFGLIQRETADTVYLTNPAGEEIPFPRDAIQKIDPVAVSLMPQGLDQAITRQELLDFIAFFKSRQ